MKVKGQTETLAFLERTLSDPRLRPAHREDLRKAKRELQKIMRSGKLDRRQVFRVVALISATLWEVQVQNRPGDDQLSAKVGEQDD